MRPITYKITAVLKGEPEPFVYTYEWRVGLKQAYKLAKKRLLRSRFEDSIKSLEVEAVDDSWVEITGRCSIAPENSYIKLKIGSEVSLINETQAGLLVRCLRNHFDWGQP